MVPLSPHLGVVVGGEHAFRGGHFGAGDPCEEGRDVRRLPRRLKGGVPCRVLERQDTQCPAIHRPFCSARKGEVVEGSTFSSLFFAPHGCKARVMFFDLLDLREGCADAMEMGMIDLTHQALLTFCSCLSLSQ